MDESSDSLTPDPTTSTPPSGEAPSTTTGFPLQDGSLLTDRQRLEGYDEKLQSANRIITELRTAEGDAWQKCAQLKKDTTRLKSAIKTTQRRTSLEWFSVVALLIIYVAYLYATKSDLDAELANVRAEARTTGLRIVELDRSAVAEAATHSARLAELTNELSNALRREKTARETMEQTEAEGQKRLATAANEIIQLQHRLALAATNRPSTSTIHDPGTPATTATRDHSLTNSLGMRFVRASGTKVYFSIWETRVADFRAFVEATRHDATAGVASLGKDHWKVRGDNWKSPGFSSLQAEDHAVVGVSWNDANAFCRWLSLKEGRKYRLPTDTEWSAAAGSGKYVWGDEWPPKNATGNFAGEEVRGKKWPDDDPVIPGYRDEYAGTSPVGKFGANPLGLFNLAGNVAEWCEDWYQKSMNTMEILQLYPALDDDGGGQTYRVLRGGSWADDDPNYLLSSFRYPSPPGNRVVNVGFRAVLVLGTED